MAWSATLFFAACVLAQPVSGATNDNAIAEVASPQVVRVGIVAFDDFRDELARYQQLFAEFERNDSSWKFQIAVGTYGDVLHWMAGDMIDVAILPPGVYAETLAADERGIRRYPCTLLATVGLNPATSAWAHPQRRLAGYSSTYRSVCLVPKASPLRDATDLQSAAANGDFEFLFVHPLSVAGCIAPVNALAQLGIQTAEVPTKFTYSHSESIRLTAQSGTEKQRIAFVWDDAAGSSGPSLAESVRVLPFPTLESLGIPIDVIVAREGFAHADRLKAKLIEHVDQKGQHDYFSAADAESQYMAILDWNTGPILASIFETRNRFLSTKSARQFCTMRTQPTPPRIAVVLSGGGAKCAYQVGAIAAFEEKLAELREQNSLPGLDIALVVGTSGGAINAVPIALGVTATEEGRNDFRKVWSELDQREIVRPSLLVRANMGVWFSVVQFAIVLWLVRRVVKSGSRRGWILGWSLVCLSAVEILFGIIPHTPWRWLGTNHLWHHIWLWMTFGVHFAAMGLFVIGAAILAACWKTGRREEPVAVPRRRAGVLFALGLLGLPLLQVATILWYEKTLSGGEGMERALSQKFPALVDAQLARDGLKPVDLHAELNDASRLKSMSKQLLENRCFHRDLVITGSCLEQTSTLLSNDLYFYLSASDQGARPPFGSRGMSLTETPSILMDVVLGSGSIYPVFPPREVKNFPISGESVFLVDGGFAHNSPVEAAVLWGATHIVLIEASPKEHLPRNNFLQNAVASFDHLYAQAQLLDAHSRGQVVMFTLAPAAPHLCVIDFADNLVAADIALGYKDARRESPAAAPRFRKEFGRPAFIDNIAQGRDAK